MVETITSKTNSKIKNLVALKDEKHRREQNLFIDEGMKNLFMALGVGCVLEIYTTEALSVDDENIKIFNVNEQVFEKISLYGNKKGVVFVSKIPTYDPKDYKRIIYLDDVQDPGNVGTLIRTALAFNMDAVVLSKASASIYNAKTLAAAKGAQYKIAVFSMDYHELKNELADEDQPTITTTLSPVSIPLQDCPQYFSFILVFGNEGSGVKEEIQKESDVCVNIPISRRIDSLNVGVAGGIVMHYFA